MVPQYKLICTTLSSKVNRSPFSTHQERDEVDAAVREVNRLLGDTRREEGEREREGMGGQASLSHNSLLKVDRRYVHVYMCRSGCKM